MNKKKESLQKEQVEREREGEKKGVNERRKMRNTMEITIGEPGAKNEASLIFFIVCCMDTIWHRYCLSLV